MGNWICAKVYRIVLWWILCGVILLLASINTPYFADWMGCHLVLSDKYSARLCERWESHHISP